MTEEEWLKSEDLEHLLKWVQRSKRYRPDRQKVQKIANALVDRCMGSFVSPVALEARAFLDQLASRPFSREEYLKDWRLLYRPLQQIDHGHVFQWAMRVSDEDWNYNTPETSARSVSGYVAQLLGEQEPMIHVAILRDIFGNPFRPVSFSPEWRTSTAVAIAQGMYDSRDFSPMPILADALQDAGCDVPEIIDHCHGLGPHVRGCWVVDGVLGKS